MPADLTSTNIRKLINDIVGTWRTMIESHDVTLTCFIADDIHEDYLINQKKFHACLNTLVSNAAHYTDSGRVHVHVTADGKDQSNMRNFTLIVADTGRGISNELQLDIIRGDSQTRLSDMIDIAKDLGGKISFNSSLGRGSEFIFTCPCNLADTFTTEADASEAVQDDPNELVDINVDYEDIPIHAPQTPIEPETVQRIAETAFDPDNLRGLKVLIVDDVSSNQDVIKLFLKPEGCECFCISAGQDALEALKTQSVDIILMDIRMPGMNGIETTQAIRDSDLAVKNVPIIALTADGSAQTNAACMAAGADLFMTKPVLCRDLLEAMRFVRRYQDHGETLHNQVA